MFIVAPVHGSSWRRDPARARAGRLRQRPRVLEGADTVLHLFLVVGKDGVQRLHPRLTIIDAEVAPVEHLAQTLRPIPLYYALAARETRKVVHVLGELADRVLEGDESSVGEETDILTRSLSVSKTKHQLQKWNVNLSNQR